MATDGGADAREFVADHGVRFPTIVGSGSLKLFNEYRIFSYPSFVFMDNGRHVHTMEGWSATVADHRLQQISG